MIRERGGKLLNATFGGSVDTVPRVPFAELCRPYQGSKAP
jgi:hypothetical protein